ncbi:alpha/beta hydrolase [Desulfurivibrio alkaliphilus]|uniref:Temperature sensitive supressor-like protein n=1 Tax=Desulfurivibrio alkaliphilus (strain DSM 19089 / UNIQEM U267 / AHT2) TaxID=589865 RepID=D6Z447_DESAT|nr:alpha/beta hydrolase [Desulfurivibrio alkaliphilus]ADH86322.1 temperature sensitive supressor-like protein [Desulfurivibrio alkaliphilus AHT 2]
MDIRAMNYEKLAHPAIAAALFHPRADWHPPAAPAFDQEVEVVPGVKLPLRYHLGAEAAEAPNLLFFHGNGEVASDYDELGPRFNAAGINLVVAEYRGYGAATGTPSVANLVSDARKLLPVVRATLAERGKSGRLGVMGRSLGSVPAIDLAVSAPAGEVEGLIIESGIAQTLPFLLGLGVDVQDCGLSSEAEGFCNVQKMTLVEKPTYILHAQHDEIIPPGLAEALQAHCGAQSKEFQLVPGAGHNDIIERVGDLYFQALAMFCRKLGQKPRRKKMGVR